MADQHPELFADTGGQKLATLLDVAHPAQHLFETHVDRRDKPRIEATLYQWEDAEPLGLVLAATCGCYPSEAVTGRDYARLFTRAFAITPTPITPAQVLPEELFRRFTPNHLTTIDLGAAPPYSFGSREEPGFYCGNATDVVDLLNFWNLRACDAGLLFYDPAQGDRLQPLITAYAAWLRSRPKRATSYPDITVWKKDRDIPGDPTTCRFIPALRPTLQKRQRPHEMPRDSRMASTSAARSRTGSRSTAAWARSSKA